MVLRWWDAVEGGCLPDNVLAFGAFLANNLYLKNCLKVVIGNRVKRAKERGRITYTDRKKKWLNY